MTDVVEQARALRGLCDPECEGRCGACAADVVRELVEEVERLRAANGRLDGLHKPGDVIRENILKAYHLTQDQLARALRVSRLTVNELVKHRRSVTAEMALRLARLTDTSAEYWLALQQRVDLREAERRAGADLAAIVPLADVQAQKETQP